MPDNSRLTVAVHILTLLAMAGERVCPSSAVAGSVNTNPVVVRRVLGLLRGAGLVESVAGPEGGARLARPAEAIHLADVYRAVEPGPLFGLHHSTPSQACPCGRNIQPVLGEVYGRAAAAMEQALEHTTLADVVRAIEARSGGE